MREQIRTPSSTGFLASVESVRGIAALYVAVAHTMIYLLFAHYERDVLDLPTWREVAIRAGEALIHGPMAVVVFFVISGFVIGRSLDGKSAAVSCRAYLIFLARRTLRLYPAHVAALGCMIGIGWLCLTGAPAIDFSAYQPADDVYFTDWLQDIFNPLHLKTVVANLAMVRWSMNLVVWSLFVEVCVAPVLPLFHGLSRRDRWRLDGAVLAALLAIAPLCWGQLWIEYWFVFYLGMIVQTRGREWARLVAERIGTGRAAALSYAAMVLPTLVWVDHSATVIVQAFGAFSLISLIVWAERSAATRVLDHPLLRWNGRLSYSFYLWHFFILTMAVRGLYVVFPPDLLYRYELPVFVLTAATTVAAALAVAHFSYAWIEVPFIALGHRLAARWREGRGTPPAVPVGTAAE